MNGTENVLSASAMMPLSSSVNTQKDNFNNLISTRSFQSRRLSEEEFAGDVVRNIGSLQVFSREKIESNAQALQAQLEEVQ